AHEHGRDRDDGTSPVHGVAECDLRPPDAGRVAEQPVRPHRAGKPMICRPGHSRASSGVFLTAMPAAPPPSRFIGPHTLSRAVTPAVAIASPWVVPVDHMPEEGPQDDSPEVMRILVVAGDPLARTGLAALIAAMADCRVVGEVPYDAELPEVIERLAPDAVV